MTTTTEMLDYGILIDGSHMSVTDAAKAMVRFIDAHPSLVSDKHYRSSDVHGFWVSESKMRAAESVGNGIKVADAHDWMIWCVDRIIDDLNYHDSLAWFVEDNSLYRESVSDGQETQR